VGHEPDPARCEHGDEYVLGCAGSCEASRVEGCIRELEEDDVRLDGGRIGATRRGRGNALGQPAGARLVVSQPRDVVADRVQTTGGKHTRLPHRSTKPVPHLPRLLGTITVTHQDK